jgi:hypothetical protein
MLNKTMYSFVLGRCQVEIFPRDKLSSLRQVSWSVSVFVEEKWAKILNDGPYHMFSSVFRPLIVLDVKLYTLNVCLSLLGYT